MKVRSGLVLILAVFSARRVAAQNVSSLNSLADTPPDPPKVEVIRKILAVTGANDLLKQIIDANVTQSITLLRQNPLFPPAFLDEAQTRLTERLKDIDMGEFTIPFYAKNFSLEELGQILVFDQSATGQKVTRLLPGMYSDVSAAARVRGKQIGSEVAREILAEHPEYSRQMEANAGKTESQSAPAAASGEGQVYKIGNGVTPPLLTAKREPHYTPQAIAAKLSGTVLLALVVDETGIPRNIRVVRPLGSGLDEKAMEAVQKWRFKPGMKDGKAVATMATVEVSFRLLQNPSAAK